MSSEMPLTDKYGQNNNVTDKDTTYNAKALEIKTQLSKHTIQVCQMAGSVNSEP